jgi:Mn2+-dependent serine/threonine protein kinase
MDGTLTVNGLEYRVLKLLGHGKGGYSYLAEGQNGPVVLKQIHHEPCAYYTFGNKIEAERGDYDRLTRAGIRIPTLLDIDFDTERIIKEYVEGDTAMERLQRGEDVSAYLPQVREMAQKARAAGLNIDYYPTNFIISDGLLWYIDYECNGYMDEWSFENWGIRYWTRTPEMEAVLKRQ